MNKGIIALCLIFLALAAAIAIKPSQAAQKTPTVSVNPAQLNLTTASIGQIIQINLNVSNVQGLWGWAIQNLDFNPAVLNVTNVQEGPFLKNKDTTFFLWASNSTLAFSKGDIPEINCAFAEYTTVNGSGVLATISFRVLSAGTSPIKIGAAALLSDIPSDQLNQNTQINCTWTNGTVTIASIDSTTQSPGVNSPTQSPNSDSANPNPQDTSSTSPDGANETVGARSPSILSNIYLITALIIVIVGVVLTVVVFRKRK